ncbi:MarR family transcriptional regulator [Natronorubrum sp. JWXQ-INN-674]|uniref:MarR family transcriptional regulator n=1 Tax=Natronorubrum halalkaliphilum TaxID=2691917 RepID=A0A6B0VMZ2_9EURY|nr:MarR family transcriptional regulator [Natronorubrum halalkaliphilum]MXV62545.1 MarR family transcriptional regulator [Natronorubrum halalkaliphilum]
MSTTESELESTSESESESDTETDEAESVTPLVDLPPSSKLVYKVLEYEGSMTQEEIANESRLCPRTVRYALGKLEDEKLVDSRVSLTDARQSKYSVVD